MAALRNPRRDGGAPDDAAAARGCSIDHLAVVHNLADERQGDNLALFSGFETKTAADIFFRIPSIAGSGSRNWRRWSNGT